MSDSELPTFAVSPKGLNVPISAPLRPSENCPSSHTVNNDCHHNRFRHWPIFIYSSPNSTTAHSTQLTTPQEAQTARVEGVVFNAAVGVCRAIPAYEFSSHK